MAGRHFSHRARTTRRPSPGAPIDRRIPGGAARDDRDLENRLKKAAEITAKACAARARTFSRRIPSSIHVTGNLGGGIWIEAGGPTAPAAYPSDPPDPPSRHPLFAEGPRGTGRWKHWYTQPYRPFLEEGAEVSADAASQEVAKVLDDWARRRGFDHR